MVWRYEPGNGLRRLFDHNHCHTLARGYDGVIYGENVGGESRAGSVVGVWRLSESGERTFVLRPTSRPDPSIWVVRDAAGNGYAWEGDPETKRVSRILKRTPHGEVRVLSGSAWGYEDGAGARAQFGEVAALAALPDGTLFLVDSGDLRRVNGDGAVTTVARDIVSTIPGGMPHVGGFYNHRIGMAVDPRGIVYIADFERRNIVRWDSQYGARIAYTSGGVANWLSRGSWGLRPTGVAVAGDSLYVMEDWSMPTLAAEIIGNPRISRIAADGTVVRVVTVASTAALAIILGLIGGSLAILANMISFVMIGKINERVPDSERISYLWWGTEVRRRFKQLYPESKLTFLLDLCVILMLICVPILLWVWVFN